VETLLKHGANPMLPNDAGEKALKAIQNLIKTKENQTTPAQIGRIQKLIKKNAALALLPKPDIEI